MAFNKSKTQLIIEFKFKFLIKLKKNSLNLRK